MKLIDLVNARDSLQKLIAQDLPIRTAYQLMKLTDECNRHLGFYGGELAKFDPARDPERLKELEEMDDRYLNEMPSVRELARMYGNPENQQLFRIRDLALIWQQRYISENGNRIYDMHDETHSFSVHLRTDELLINRMVVENGK
jgi:hypothetical protein